MTNEWKNTVSVFEVILSSIFVDVRENVFRSALKLLENKELSAGAKLG